MRRMLVCAVGMWITVGAMAQTPGAKGKDVDLRTAAAIKAQAKTLLAEAQKSPAGVATMTLEEYPGHYTMLAVRTKDGAAEVHAGYSDFFIAQEGEATVMTGGTVVDGKEISLGETRGTKVEGGTPTVLHKGDILHIAPNVPHQTMVAPGKTFTYYVIKVAAPKQ